MQGRLFSEGVFSLSTANFIQAGVHRYHINHALELETSLRLGFKNFNPDLAVRTDRVEQAQRYGVSLEEGELTVQRENGTKLYFRKTTAGEFPLEALERLEVQRGRRLQPKNR